MSRDNVPTVGAGGLADRLARLEENHENLDHRLYGNGRPGDIEKIQTSVDEMKSTLAKAVGGMAVLLVVMPVVIEWIKSNLGHHTP